MVQQDVPWPAQYERARPTRSLDEDMELDENSVQRQYEDPAPGPEAIAEVGAGIQISPNGAVVLKALGLGEALERASLRAQAVELRDGYSGSVVTRLDVARLRPAQGYHFIHRADLIEILRAHEESLQNHRSGS